MTMTTTMLPPRDAALSPTVLAVLTSVGCHGLVRLTERTLPAFLWEFGAGSVVAGGVATVGLAAAVGMRSVDVDPVPGTVLATLTAVGLLAMIGAPVLDSLVGAPIPPLGWVLIGVALLTAWNAHDGLGPDGSGFAMTGPTVVADDAPRGAVGPFHDRLVAGSVGTAIGGLLATVVFTWAGAADGYSLLAVAGAAGAVTSAVTAAGREGAGASETTTSGLAGVERLRRAWKALPADARSVTVGDALVRIATSLIALSLVTLVVEAGVTIAIGPMTLTPVAAFSLLVCIESLGSLAGMTLGPMLAERVDPRYALAAGLLVLSLLPLSLFAAPTIGVLVASFLLLGARTTLRPFRPTLAGRETTSPGASGGDRAVARTPRTIREALRVAFVPVPFVGGVLYALGPAFAFGLATAVGLLGVRELVGALR